MVYTTDYQSPLGTIFLAADEKGLTGLWLEGQKYYAAQIKKEECRQEKTPVLKDAERWLDIYFQGINVSNASKLISACIVPFTSQVFMVSIAFAAIFR